MPLMPPDGRPDALQAARATIAEQFLARQSLEDELRAATARADRCRRSWSGRAWRTSSRR